MYSNFKDKAIELVKQAATEDNAGNYQKAFQLYMAALDYFTTHLKYEKNPSAKKAITAKVREYITRAEYLRSMLDSEGDETSNQSGQGGSQATANPKTGTSSKEDELEKLKSSLGNAILEEKPNVKWDDVAGLEGAKDALKEAVILPVKFPQFFTGKRKPWSGILLYGPPGTGKSYLAKAVATEADSTFFSVSSSDLVSKWMGESERLVSSLFALAREKAPSIIFIDEIDALCSARGEGESEAARRIKTEFLVQMQGVGHGSDDKRVLMLGATNLPYALDQAVRRRFDKRIHIPLPEAPARASMFRIHLGDTPHSLTARDFDALGEATPGFSGSDVAIVVKDVLMQPVRKTQDATHFKQVRGEDGAVLLEPCSAGDAGAFPATLQTLADQGKAQMVHPPKITYRDFEKVFLRARPTVSQDDLASYQRFTEEFGEEG
ncbi:Protein SUPPRESSOR OF K(+) TRANSPORT GROWTH DEFT 1 [Prototheca wickerhamii]|uniref:Protein SUPPRESSOR OF K(+) TRANSPORT GROWTH DEFT 1 n=1 Tax=Prototheca wickerhamii TaxID=3111 RepID=A0AAD9MM15_PROWI|nr:Protein SUPPRESSOR OF K(+) TRANSPORT GROWTH DEFT 1 [Prototheca wickerhamii]